MLFSTLILVTFTTCNAFNSMKPTTKFKYVGDTAPLGHFDPLKLSQGKSEESLKYLRETELQHSRVAMTSMIILPKIDYFSNDDQLAINYLSDHPLMFQLGLLFAFGYLESERILKSYKNPFQKEIAFSLKDDVEPGMYFDNKLDDNLMNIELNNGRLAMIGSLGYIVQELVTKQPIF